jgi:hypothetical protein
MSNLKYIVGAGLGALAATVVARTIAFKPEKLPEAKEDAIELDRDKIIADMSDMIRCKTVSYTDESLVDKAEFTKFEALLCERFPLIHEKCTFEKVYRFVRWLSVEAARYFCHYAAFLCNFHCNAVCTEEFH